jgi:hypothetical protein
VSIIRSENDWWLDESGEDVVVTGRDGAVIVVQLAAGEEREPAFDYYEKVGYVARGTVVLFVLDLSDTLRAQELKEGSFFRVPPTLISWLRNDSETPATVTVGLAPAYAEQGGELLDATALHAEWEDPDDLMQVRRGWTADPRQYRLSENDQREALGRPLNGLVQLPNEVNEIGITNHLNVPLRTKIVCGERISIMVAQREGAYHSTPHVHPAEQINAVIRGSNWAFCVGPDGEHTAVETGQGSIFRFPNLVPHWAWGRDGSGSKVVEFHFPGLHGDPDMAGGTVSLVTADPILETPTDRARNIFVDAASIPVEDIEAATV